MACSGRERVCARRMSRNSLMETSAPRQRSVLRDTVLTILLLLTTRVQAADPVFTGRADPPDQLLRPLVFAASRRMARGGADRQQPLGRHGLRRREDRVDRNWTININTEMNMWSAETTNLAECHEPLFDLIHGLAENGRKTPRTNYGCGGWVAYHNTDVWRQSCRWGPMVKAIPPGHSGRCPASFRWTATSPSRPA